MNRTRAIAFLAAFGVLAFSFGPALAPAQGDSDDDLARKLEGTWRVTVTLRDCGTGAQSPPFQSLLTFARGGTLTGTTASPAFLPGQRTPDYGMWSPAGGHAFRAVEEAFILFDSPHGANRPGFRSGTQRISQTIELRNDDEFTSTASTSYFDVGGKLVTKGCASAIGRRIK
jgi:hypothetical protein